VDEDTQKKIIEKQKEEIKRRIQILRNNKPLPDIKNRNVILVDDGIAMGSTIRASMALCQNKNAGQITVAAPVSGPETAESLQRICDDVIVLEQPVFFQAVAQAYINWVDVSHSEVKTIMKKWNQEKERQ
jgi:putative phosphoribosyl transferase